MDFKRKVEQSLLRRKPKETPTQVFERITFYLVKKGGFSLGDLLKAPTPLVLAMNEELAKYYKEKEKQYKKAQRKK